jgi:hypothetical protein
MRGSYRMPESFNAFCNIVSFTAAKTNRIFEVSVACVRLRTVSMESNSLWRGMLTEGINLDVLDSLG